VDADDSENQGWRLYLLFGLGSRSRLLALSFKDTLFDNDATMRSPEISLIE